MTIKAPYNFVPLSNIVYFPEWGNDVSQDIPFEDGMSGSIMVNVEAKTPIFVRNGHTQADALAKNEDYKSFCITPDGVYYIPATTIKGELRTILSILGFGKMSPVDNKRYAIRDIRNQQYMSAFNAESIHCGWMTKVGEDVVIEDHGIPRRISHQDIDKWLYTNFCEEFSAENKKCLTDERRSPIYKYDLTKNKQLTGRFCELPENSGNPVDKRIKVVFDKNGKSGSLVFTGQPGGRKDPVFGKDGHKIKKAEGKYYEFVFLDTVESRYTFNIYEEDSPYSDFCFIYKDSKEWEYWKSRMNKGERVPVFFFSQNGELKHFGLSYLYKLPFNGKVNDYLPVDHCSDQYDLADLIFGYVGKKNALKGRVYVSNALCSHCEKLSEKMPYCGSPKPTYYPAYLNQKGKNGFLISDYKTMLDADAEVKGWKMYPVRLNYTETFSVPKNQEKNLNPFKALDSGSTFQFKVSFHNLKKVELGALLYIIELRKNCLHSIGFAKPYGYGAVEMRISEMSDVTIEDVQQCKEAFLSLMENVIPNYEKSPQVKEFFTMHRFQEYIFPLEYMDEKTYGDSKKRNKKKDIPGEYLPYASELIKKSVQTVKKEDVICEAEVVLASGRIIQAKMLNAKDSNPKALNVDDCKDRIKKGDKVLVEKIMKGNNVKELRLIKKL